MTYVYKSVPDCLKDALKHTVLWPREVAPPGTLAHRLGPQSGTIACRVWPQSPAPTVCQLKMPASSVLLFFAKSHRYFYNFRPKLCLKWISKFSLPCGCQMLAFSLSKLKHESQWTLQLYIESFVVPQNFHWFTCFKHLDIACMDAVLGLLD